MIVTGIAVAVVMLTAVSQCTAKQGPSESYQWGQMAGNSAVSLVKAGVGFDGACKSSMEAGAMWADDPILNQTPPPKNFNSSDARQGCLDQLHKRLGY